MNSYVGLTWDHPRGYDALAAAAASSAAGSLSVIWRKQPLEGFEEHPIAELCAAHDLVVLDHPHIGEAVRAGCLQPLEAVFGVDEIKRIKDRTIGSCLSSYCYAGQHWALPLDAAAQVLAFRPDRVHAPPTSWEEVEAMSREVPTVLSLAGPHAALTLFSIALSIDQDFAVEAHLFRAGIGEYALARLQSIFSNCLSIANGKNPIGILQAMAETDAIALCPLIFGYVNYAVSSDDFTRKPIAFANAPSSATGRPRSILGGTGIGITSRCHITPELLSHLRWMMSEETQTRFIPTYSGQPSARCAWRDATVNRRWGNFYQATIDTIEEAHVRPRYEGWIAFQKYAAEIVRAALAERSAPKDVVSHLEKAYLQSNPNGQER